MNDYNYYIKYNKYKYKYINIINQHGGITDIPKNKINLKIDNLEIPSKIKFYINNITIPDTNIIQVGSSVNKIQPYFSDIDIMNIVNLKLNKTECINHFIDYLKEIILNIKLIPNTFFSDFKAGGLHWSEKEILNEIHNKSKISLCDACQIKDVIKLDIIAPYNERYIEISSFYVLESLEGYINIESNYFKDFSNSLKKDIIYYKNIKPFKAIKRVWSLMSINNNIKILDKLSELIKSNVSLLSRINSDIETIELLLIHNNNYDYDFIITELDLIKEHISHIIDIDFDNYKIILIITNIILLFKIIKLNNNNNDKQQLLSMIKKLQEELLIIINKETNNYLTIINFNFDILDIEPRLV